MCVATFRLSPAHIKLYSGTVKESRTCDDLGLSKDDLLGDAALPLVQLLANACDDTKTVFQSVGRLLTNELTQHTEVFNHKLYTGGIMCFLLIAPLLNKNKDDKSSRITSSLSPKTWRLSECPRITQFTPQSLIIAGLQVDNIHIINTIKDAPFENSFNTSFDRHVAYLISPVKAPLATL